MDDIVERLRKGDPCGNCKRDDCRCVIMEDAADDIERLRKESRLYWDAFQKAANEIEKLREDNFKMWTILCDTPERLREALRKIDAVKYYRPEGASMECDEMHKIARAALKEKK